MENVTEVTIWLAISIAFIHTIAGPDHYIPFIAMQKARNWSIRKTTLITALCGLGHVGSTILIGIGVIALGYGLSSIESLESLRGSLAAWLFIGFGFAYMVWGIRKAIKNKPHKHVHIHSDGTVHNHDHTHKKDHLHVHEEKKKNITPWVLFVIFFLGPCEPFLPVLVVPAYQQDITLMIGVIVAFSLVTILTMVAVVLLSAYGLKLLPFGKLERYTHALAGFMIFASGVGIQFLGL
jgi:nickel/cobalt exporter